jgi:uncharacterized phage-associated protein
MNKHERQKLEKSNPVSVFDVAAYILEKQHKGQPITAWKLQKLVYYCQAWSLVWDEQALFEEKILAWVNGPVVKELYALHKGQFRVEKLFKGNPEKLSKEQKDSVDHVLKAYGDKTAQWLSDLTHMEEPWLEARKGLNHGERGEVEIKLSTMHEYYTSIDSKHRLAT